MKKGSVSYMVLCLVLLVTLVVPTGVLAGKANVVGEGRSGTQQMGTVEIVKKAGIEGVPPIIAPARGPKPHAATGILGEEVAGKRYAIVIGISDYPGSKHVLEGGYDLSYAHDDAEAMGSLLKSIYGFDSIQLLADKDATREAVLSEIAELSRSVCEGDEVVFFFSGHGARFIPARGQSQVGIVTWGWESQTDPTDFSLEVIWDRELKEAFSEFKTDRIAFIFDCCLAGGMIELGTKGRVISMATTQQGVAYEYGEDYGEPWGDIGQINHGLFTYFFAVLGMQTGLADTNAEDGAVTVEEAFDFSRGWLESLSIKVPQLWQIPTIADRFKQDLVP
ncbi:MAG: caspase domain-containing protein [Dehalococcoidia bacterium]